MTTKSTVRRSTPKARIFLAKISALLPVSKRIRFPLYSTSAAKPQSRVRPARPPKASYRIVTRLGKGGGVACAGRTTAAARMRRSEEHTSELQSQSNLVCRLLLEKKKQH